MSKRILFLAASLAVTLPAAQATEVGVLSGLSVFTAPDQDAVTIFGVPGSSARPTSSLYITTFPTPNLALEPQVGALVVSGGGHRRAARRPTRERIAVPPRAGALTRGPR